MNTGMEKGITLKMSHGYSILGEDTSPILKSSAKKLLMKHGKYMDLVAAIKGK